MEQHHDRAELAEEIATATKLIKWHADGEIVRGVTPTPETLLQLYKVLQQVYRAKNYFANYGMEERPLHISIIFDPEGGLTDREERPVIAEICIGLSENDEGVFEGGYVTYSLMIEGDGLGLHGPDEDSWLGPAFEPQNEEAVVLSGFIKGLDEKGLLKLPPAPSNKEE